MEIGLKSDAQASASEAVNESVVVISDDETSDIARRPPAGDLRDRLNRQVKRSSASSGGQRDRSRSPLREMRQQTSADLAQQTNKRNKLCPVPECQVQQRNLRRHVLADHIPSRFGTDNMSKDDLHPARMVTLHWIRQRLLGPNSTLQQLVAWGQPPQDFGLQCHMMPLSQTVIEVGCLRYAGQRSGDYQVSSSCTP